MKELNERKKEIITKWWPRHFTEAGAVCAGLKESAWIPLSDTFSEKEFSKEMEELGLKYAIWKSPDSLPISSFQTSLSKSQKICDKVKEASLESFERSKKLKDLGLLLDYPECCVDYFTAEGFEGRSKMSPFYKSRPEDFVRVDYRMNTLFNFTSYRDQIWEKLQKCFGMPQAENYYLIHVPCSIDCPASLESAKKMNRFMKVNFPEVDKKYKKVLKKIFLIIGPLEFLFLDYKKKGENKVEIQKIQATPNAPDEIIEELTKYLPRVFRVSRLFELKRMDERIERVIFFEG